MQELIGDKQETKAWLSSMFKGWGLTGWLASIIRTILFIFLVVFLTLIAFSILNKVVLKTIQDPVSPTKEDNHVAVFTHVLVEKHAPQSESIPQCHNSP